MAGSAAVVGVMCTEDIQQDGTGRGLEKRNGRGIREIVGFRGVCLSSTDLVKTLITYKLLSIINAIIPSFAENNIPETHIPCSCVADRHGPDHCGGSELTLAEATRWRQATRSDCVIQTSLSWD
jgi:hypothetical protein